MILRRFMKHVTDQNWFAVGLDVIVVIVGIFLGFQVQDWNEGRGERLTENSYLTRLHSEVAVVSNIVENNYVYRQAFHHKIEEILDAASGKVAGINLTNAHCNALNQSHIYFNPTTSLSTISEIINSGNMTVIQSENIIDLITRYTLEIGRQNALIASIRYDSVEIATVFPELITLNKTADISLGELLADGRDCNFSLLIENNDFKAQLFANGNRYRNYVDHLLRQLEILQALHKELDKALDITHAGENP